jgi:hypothetical protein
VLSPGARIAQYEILSVLGVGGMGEVYRARDTRLGREVAVKTLPETFAADPSRLARLEREARVLAALNHPHVAAIHQVEQEGGTRVLVLELVPGETLAERLRRGPLPVREALPLFRQVAEGLEAAHEKGVLHRDLKPANVKITPEGRAKILDFGLAKAFAVDDGAPDVSHSPTISYEGTEHGVILGTAAYMSPEQARGKPVDRRTDVWSFGSVLFEALTGRQAFPGETISDIIAAILAREPDWSRLPGETPPRVRELLHRCLQKDVARRLHDIGDARIELDEAIVEDERGSSTRSAFRPARRAVLPWIGLVLVAGALAGAVATRVWEAPRAPTTVVRLGVRVSIERPLPVFVFSPDGGTLAFVGADGELHLRPLDRIDPVSIGDSTGAREPFYSPDGRWIGFFSESRLKKVPLEGGTPVSISLAPDARGAAWAPDDSIIFAPAPAGPLWRVPASGGPAQRLTRLDTSRGELSHRWPAVLPDGTVLYVVKTTETTSFDDTRIVAQRLDGGLPRVVIEGGTSPAFLPPDHLLYYRAGALYSVPFDARRLEKRGSPEPVVEDVLGDPTVGYAHYSISATGSLAYVPGKPIVANTSLVWVDRLGREEPLVSTPMVYTGPRVSPDGTRVAVAMNRASNDIWIFDVARPTPSRLTFGPGNSDGALWTPDGKRIAYASERGGFPNIFWRAADGRTRSSRSRGRPTAARWSSRRRVRTPVGT